MARAYENWALSEAVGIRCLLEGPVAFANGTTTIAPPRLAVVNLPGGERGLMVVSSETAEIVGVTVPAGSRILSVPFASMLSLEDLFRSPFSQLSGGAIAEDDALALLLLYEIYELREASRFWQHLQILPKAYHSIPNFTSDELEWIRGSNLYFTAKVWQRQIANDFASLAARSLGGKGGDEQGLPLSSVYPWLTHDNYVWALSTIWSRFVTIDRKDRASGETRRLRCMVPLFDLMNHAPGSGASHFFDEASDSAVLYTADAIPAGAQLMLNYGRLGNDKLLKIYGFVIPPSVGNDSFNYVGVHAALHPATPLFAAKKQLLLDLGLPVDGTSPLEVRRGEIPRDLMRFVRVQRAASGNDILLLRASEGNYPSVDEDRKTSGTAAAIVPSSLLELEREVTQAVLCAAREMLEQYPFDLDEDRRALLSWGLLLPQLHKEGGMQAEVIDTTQDATPLSNASFVHPSERFKSAVVLRYSEMTILGSAIEELEKYAARIASSGERRLN